MFSFFHLTHSKRILASSPDSSSMQNVGTFSLKFKSAKPWKIYSKVV